MHDPGTNFISEKFKNNAKIVGVSCKKMPIKTHWVIGKIKQAYSLLKRSYNIFEKKFKNNTDDEILLQMVIKILNNTAGPNGLILILLIFGAYPKINQNLPFAPNII